MGESSTVELENSARAFGEQAKALPIGSMVRDIAVGVAQAQAEMDRSAVAQLKGFAKKDIDLYGDGTKHMSMLELGFSPQFLFFQKVVIRVRMDLRFHVEEQKSESTSKNTRMENESSSSQTEQSTKQQPEPEPEPEPAPEPAPEPEPESEPAPAEPEPEPEPEPQNQS